jgi:hypothetical protein
LGCEPPTQLPELQVFPLPHAVFWYHLPAGLHNLYVLAPVHTLSPGVQSEFGITLTQYPPEQYWLPPHIVGAYHCPLASQAR